jgi:hypothetical protein
MSGADEPTGHVCKQAVKMPPSLLFLDEDLGSLHFLFTIFFFSQLCLGALKIQAHYLPLRLALKSTEGDNAKIHCKLK